MEWRTNEQNRVSSEPPGSANVLLGKYIAVISPEYPLGSILIS